MPSDTPHLVSDDHALMALGGLFSRISEAVKAEHGIGGVVTAEEDGVLPAAPQWLDAWRDAVNMSREEALDMLREQFGAREPTHEERLDIETIAQAHYDAYARLDKQGQERTGGFVAWEAIPEERRDLMMAVVADLIVSAYIYVGPSAGHSNEVRQAWVVFDGSPGHEAPRFVETENGLGEGIGNDHGLRWEPHPTATGMWRLGPFPSEPSAAAEEAATAGMDARHFADLLSSSGFTWTDELRERVRRYGVEPQHGEARD